MTITRTRITGDYIKRKENDGPGITRTRVSPNYIKSSIFGRTVTRTPIFPTFTSFFSTPTYIHSPIHTYPSFIPRSVIVHDTFETIAGVIGLTIITVGIVAILALAPHCHNDEVCENMGLGLQNCHIERVCLNTIF